MNKKILIVNGHIPYPTANGDLTRDLVTKAKNLLETKGHEVKVTIAKDDYDANEEVDKIVWADVIIFQFPSYWFSVPWVLKKYMDDVFTAGLDGRLCTGDGRSRSDPDKQYGTGGTLDGNKFMLSITFNAPKAAFSDVTQYLFQGDSVDSVYKFMHFNFRFFNASPLPTFAFFDVYKNPDIEADFEAFESHISKYVA